MGRRRKQKTTRQIAKDAAKGVAELNRGTEDKYIEAASTLTCRAIAPRTYYFNTDIFRDAQTGSAHTLGGIDKRDGDRVRNKRLEIRAYFDNKVGVTTPADVLVRIWIFKKKDNGDTFDVDDLMSVDDEINTLRQVTNMQNTVVKYDSTFGMDHINFQQIPFHFNWHLKDVTEYLGQTTSQISTNVKRNLYGMMVMSNGVTTDNEPILRFRYRFTYEDA